MISLLRLGLLGVSFSLRFLAAEAQDTNATCMSTYAWADNSLKQSPCVVASFLESQCFDSLFTLGALGPNQYYSPPSGKYANPCECNLVTYSLVSACSACQGSPYLPWVDWIVNCNTTSTSLPYSVPPGTEVPAWAYMGIGASGSWNSTVAFVNATSPSPSPTPSSGAPQTSHSTTNTGAIVGGVVGGVVGVAAIAGIVLWGLRRYRRQNNGKLREMSQLEISQPAPAYMFSGGLASLPPPSQPLKLYNPDDPSTFPATEPSSVVSNPFTSTPATITESIGQQSSSQVVYNGAPEV